MQQRIRDLENQVKGLEKKAKVKSFSSTLFWFIKFYLLSHYLFQIDDEAVIQKSNIFYDRALVRCERGKFIFLSIVFI